MKQHVAALNDDHTAPAAGPCTCYRHHARHLNGVYCPQHHLATHQLGGVGLNDACVAQAGGKKPNRIAFKPTQINGLVAGRLQLKGNAIQPAAGQQYLLASGQHDAAVSSF